MYNGIGDFMLILDFILCNTKGFLQVMNFIKIFLNIIRFAIPLLLIITISIDLFKNVINPDNKDGLNNIKRRVIAAIIIFLIPSVIDLVMVLIQKNFSSNEETNYKLTNCYTNANDECIQKIDDYLNCTDYNKDKKCQKFRNCNSYKIANDCKITTEMDKSSCLSMNNNDEYKKFIR